MNAISIPCPDENLKMKETEGARATTFEKTLIYSACKILIECKLQQYISKLAEQVKKWMCCGAH